MHDQFTPPQVFVMGDTQATQTAGAVAVGVAGGHYTTDELVAAGGVHVLASLEDPFPGLDRRRRVSVPQSGDGYGPDSVVDRECVFS
jgi:hypothetical protein